MRVCLLTATWLSYERGAVLHGVGYLHETVRPTSRELAHGMQEAGAPASAASGRNSHPRCSIRGGGERSRLARLPLPRLAPEVGRCRNSRTQGPRYEKRAIVRWPCFLGLFGFAHKWGELQHLVHQDWFYRQCQKCGAMRRFPPPQKEQPK